jgi:hypothetical protein
VSTAPSDKLYLRALAAARAESATTGITPTGSRLHRIYAETAAPAGGWKSKLIASRKAYLDAIEERLKRIKAKYIRARHQIFSTLKQADLDRLAELTHHQIRKVSKGHVGWRVIHPEGLHEYFLVDNDLHRASHVHEIDYDTHQRMSPTRLATGLQQSIAVLREHDVEVPADLLKKEKAILRRKSGL